jgi:hypothetical protein
MKDALKKALNDANNLNGSLNYHSDCLIAHANNDKLTREELSWFMIHVGKALRRLSKENGGWEKTV